MNNPRILLDAVDRSYRQQISDPEWLREIVETLAPDLDAACGVAAWYYDASDLSNLRIFHPTCLGTRDGTLEAVFASASHPETTLQMLRDHWATPAGTASSQIPNADNHVPYRDTIHRIGIRDIVTINAYDVDGRGLAINAFHDDRVELSRAQVEQLEYVAAHLISAYRLRRSGGSVEALVCADGSLRRIYGDAIAKADEIVEGVHTLEKARGSMREHAPEEALAAWRALVDARWSLVDFYDRDGVRYLVAKVNEPQVKPATKLTARERQVVALVSCGHSNKLISYDLGIAEGTVAAHISSAMRKLGVTNRSQLAVLFAEVDRGEVS